MFFGGRRERNFSCKQHWTFLSPITWLTTIDLGLKSMTLHLQNKQKKCGTSVYKFLVCPKPDGQSAYRRLDEKCPHFRLFFKDGAELVLWWTRFCFVTAASLRILPHFCPTRNQKAGADRHARIHTQASVYSTNIYVRVDNTSWWHALSSQWQHQLAADKTADIAVNCLCVCVSYCTNIRF